MGHGLGHPLPVGLNDRLLVGKLDDQGMVVARQQRLGRLDARLDQVFKQHGLWVELNHAAAEARGVAEALDHPDQLPDLPSHQSLHLAGGGVVDALGLKQIHADADRPHGVADVMGEGRQELLAGRERRGAWSLEPPMST